MSAPTTTVLTPVRNGQRYIAEAIASIGSQTSSDWEHVIVDDGSSDDTPRIVETAMRSDPRIRLVRRTHGGDVYAACNEGLQHSRGRFIVYLDSDDVAEPDRIERQVAYLDARPGLRACAGRVVYLPKSSRLHRRRLSRWLPAPTPKAMRWHLCVRRNLVHSSACVERAAFMDLGGYREGSLHQDFRMWCELSRRHWLGFVPAVVVNKRLHADQLTKQSSFESMRAPTVDILEEHVSSVIGGSWTRDELIALFDLQRRARPRIAEGLSVIKRWRDGWLADDGLAANDRAYLKRLSAVTRSRLFALFWRFS